MIAAELLTRAPKRMILHKRWRRRNDRALAVVHDVHVEPRAA